MGKATRHARLARYREARDTAMRCARYFAADDTYDADGIRGWVRIAREFNWRLVVRLRAQHSGK